ncbi:MAG: CCGSCS motif protein [Pseudomonadota bacterium]
MGLKNLFKKDKAEKPVVQAQEAVSAKPDAAVNVDPKKADAQQKGKHGESGNCCGSCQ